MCLAIRTKINPQIKELRWRSHFLIEKKSNLITGVFPYVVQENVLLSAVAWVGLFKLVLELLMESVWMDGRAGSEWG